MRFFGGRTFNPNRVFVLIGIRFLALLLCFAILVVQQTGGIYTISSTLYPFTYSLLLSLLFLNIGYLFIARSLKNTQNFVVLQILIDILAETVLIYSTGGILSIFVSLYFISILSAGILASLRISLLCASIATICISGIVTIYYLSVLERSPLLFLGQYPPVFFPKDNDLPFCRAYLFAQSVGFFVVAYLSGRLALVLSRERILHEEILENLAEGVMVVTEHKNISFVNIMARKILGLDPKAVFQGKAIIEVLDTERHIDLLKIIMTGKAIVYNTNINDAPIRITLSPLQIRNKTTYILILSDVTYQKKMEEAINQAHRLSILHEMATNIAHEIRNPLASIRGAAQELQENFAKEDPNYDLMDITVRESDRLNRILSNFLEFSKLRSPQFEKCDITEIIREVTIFLKQRPMTYNVKICQQICPQFYVYADSEQLRQVFYNLGINALEASEEGGKIEIIAESKNLQDFYIKSHQDIHISKLDQVGIQISFCDSGKGVAEQYLEKIFTPFFTTKSAGTGMGLAIVNQVLQSHEAIFYVDSKENQGFCFHIWFPGYNNDE